MMCNTTAQVPHDGDALTEEIGGQDTSDKQLNCVAFHGYYHIHAVFTRHHIRSISNGPFGALHPDTNYAKPQYLWYIGILKEPNPLDIELGKLRQTESIPTPQEVLER